MNAPDLPLPAPVTLVTGPEELLSDRAVSVVVRSVRAHDPEADVRDLEAAGLAAGTVTELTSPSLFGERKVIVVRGLQDATDGVLTEILGCVTSPEDDVTMVLTHRSGQRGKKVLDAARKAGATEVSCAEVKTRRDKLSFVSGEFSAAHRRAASDAVETLLDALGGDLRALAGAVHQLCADTTGTIDADVVRRYYAGHAEVSGFTVADRAVEGRADEALLALRRALGSGTDPVLIVSALAMALRSIVKVATAPKGLREADLARELAMPPWKIRNVRGQVRGWDGDGIAVAVTAVAAADAAVKGAAVDPLYELERAVRVVAGARTGR